MIKEPNPFYDSPVFRIQRQIKPIPSHANNYHTTPIRRKYIPPRNITPRNQILMIPLVTVPPKSVRENRLNIRKLVEPSQSKIAFHINRTLLEKQLAFPVQLKGSYYNAERYEVKTTIPKPWKHAWSYCADGVRMQNGYKYIWSEDVGTRFRLEEVYEYK